MNDLEKKLIGCIDLEKLSVILVEDLIIGTLKKVVDDSTNKFDDAAFNMLAPIAKEKGEVALKELIAKLKA